MSHLQRHQIRKEILVFTEEIPNYNADGSGSIMEIGKPTSLEGTALGSEAAAMAANVKKAAYSIGIEPI